MKQEDEKTVWVASAGGVPIGDKLSFYERDELILIDEVLTPDSSRFWPLDQYQTGKGQPSFDKQFLRDYLLTLDWDKKPPAPTLPADIISKTGARYAEAVEKIIGS